MIRNEETVNLKEQGIERPGKRKVLLWEGPETRSRDIRSTIPQGPRNRDKAKGQLQTDTVRQKDRTKGPERRTNHKVRR
jgi:hypothetical protein